MSTLYMVERRKGNAVTEDPHCFLGSSMEKVKEWILDNTDFEHKDVLWYWVVIKVQVDYPFGGELFAVFDWEGNELEEQPTTY